MTEKRFHKRSIFLVLYILFALLPIYWMINMSFKTNEEILSSFSFFPQQLTWANYARIFTDESWYSGYINSLIYVAINTVISLTVALPAAYAFSSPFRLWLAGGRGDLARPSRSIFQSLPGCAAPAWRLCSASSGPGPRAGSTGAAGSPSDYRV